MQITVENTPNPLAKKFIVTGAGEKPFGPYDDVHVSYMDTPKPTAYNRTLAEAETECPLAAVLLKAGAHAVMLDQGPQGAFVSVGVKESSKNLWDSYQELTVTALQTYVGNGKPALTQSFKPVETQEAYHRRVLESIGEKYGEHGVTVVKPILKAIEVMNPHIKKDGGNLKFQSIDFATSRVYVEMTGACSGCSKTGDTLGNIQKALKEHFGLDITMVNTAKTPTTAPIFIQR